MKTDVLLFPTLILRYLKQGEKTHKIRYFWTSKSAQQLIQRTWIQLPGSTNSCKLSSDLPDRILMTDQTNDPAHVKLGELMHFLGLCSMSTKVTSSLKDPLNMDDDSQKQHPQTFLIILLGSPLCLTTACCLYNLSEEPTEPRDLQAFWVSKLHHFLSLPLSSTEGSVSSEGIVTHHVTTW